MQSRREFIQQMGTGAVIAGIHGDWFNSGTAPYPPYPSVPDQILDRLEWSPQKSLQVTKEDAKWSIRTYEWKWLRERVRKKTSETMDIPLGGLIAFRIGDTADLFNSNNKFAIPTLAKWDLDDNIQEHFTSYLQNFPKAEFDIIGEIEWNLGPFFPSSAGVLANKCLPSGTLTTEAGGSVQMHQFNLEYELTDTSANSGREVDVNKTTLDFFGWLAGWNRSNHVYAVGATHPRAIGDWCGLDNPHIEEVLSEAVGQRLDLELEYPLYGKVHTMMGAVQ